MKKIIIANWKMNPESLEEARRLFVGVQEAVRKLPSVQTIIAPPFLYIAELNRMYRGKRIYFAAQNVSEEAKGPFTGEISPLMLKKTGVTHVLVGHSERRALGETNVVVRHKLSNTLSRGLTAVLCVGESVRDDTNGSHLSFISKQVESALKEVSGTKLSRIIIAYEPIWAIGKSGRFAMKPDELHETILFIRKVLSKLYDKKRALSVPVLYGGSVERENAETLLLDGTADGFLVGHASLSSSEFSDILRIANKI